MIYLWLNDCAVPNAKQFCKCYHFFPYEGYYVIGVMAVLVFIGMALLYSATCRKIYFSRKLKMHVSHLIQVLFYT